jgi:exodeoxyribonuclease V gamma subunit
MLHICRSNRIEFLLQRLADRLAGEPLSLPLQPEVVVTPSSAMARWVNLQLARRHGVAANYRYPLPASFIWRLSRDLLGALPEADPLEPKFMTWRVYALLPQMLPEPAFGAIARYLRQDAEGVKRLQLAGRIADVFDRYQFYRPQLLRDWEAGKDASWQAALWRCLTREVGQHRLAVIARLLSLLRKRGHQKGGRRPFLEEISHERVSDPLFGLPERVSLFAISSLPPLFVEVLDALARHTQVEFYLHSPTDQFWSDLVSQKALARKRLASPAVAELWETGNSLLGSWGRQGQTLQDLLLMQDTPVTEDDAFHVPAAETLLERLQRDIFILRPLAACPAERVAVDIDESLQVHVCHSPQRECQVLHDRLLAMLDSDPTLHPEDILVMVPEISLYAPYIEAVFDQDSATERPFIPWNLSDISARDEHPLVQVFLQLLALPHSRFSHTEILSCLDVPELAGRFALDGEAVAQIRDWLSQARLRWGLNGEHKRQFGLPPIEENTWAQAERRLFGGYALGDDVRFEGIAPIAGVEGARSEILGRFWRLLSTLGDYAERLRRPRRVGEWQECLVRLLDDFFGGQEDEEGRIQKIRDALAELAAEAAVLEETLPVTLVRHWLERRLDTQARHGHYFSGGVTFCGMRPMRSLPFRVICVLGLHEQAFPRRDQPADFDLMREHWRAGDPRKGGEDRYLFLETLLCARKILYFSYVGRDIRKNSERQPSVLLRELLDYIDQQYALAGDTAGEKPSARLMHVHPLQAFSPRNYHGEARSYDGEWCRVAQALEQQEGLETIASSWNRTRLSDPPAALRTVSLNQLLRFVRHPVRCFVNTRLQIYLREAPLEEDDEVFGLDGLQSFVLKQRLVEDYLKGRPTSAAQLSAEGVLPHGAFAELAWRQESLKVRPLTERLATWRGIVPEQRLVDLVFDLNTEGQLRLAGQLKGIYPGAGLLRYRPGELKGPDILALWLEHLAWCAGREGDEGDNCSMLHGASAQFILRHAPAPAQARACLARYLHCYWQGLHRPLPLLPGASYAWMGALTSGRSDPFKAALTAWKGNDYVGMPGDRDDPYIALVMHGVSGNPIEQEEFAELAAAFYAEPLRLGKLA